MMTPVAVMEAKSVAVAIPKSLTLTEDVSVRRMLPGLMSL